MRSPDLNRADREAIAGGYYEGLITGGSEGGRNELALRLLGKPTDWVRFYDIDACRILSGDVLQFELRPNFSKPLFGRAFTTNSLGMRDREYPVEKKPDTFRIALLGSSMDMGWGVGTDETYENLLEDWLNTHAAKRGLSRRFEVLNFAVAAYSPIQRLDTYERKVRAYKPDMVIYSATMLDIRLLEIHVCNLLQMRIDSGRDFVRKAVANAAVTTADLEVGPDHQLLRKEVVKAKLQSELWSIADGVIGTLAAECRAERRPLVCLVIPRVGAADAPEARANSVARQAAISARHAVPLIDLSATFDHKDPAGIEIAAWDDHPNALGHKTLFRALAHALVEDSALYRTLFNVAPEKDPRSQSPLARK
jgi:hypothetical protein